MFNQLLGSCVQTAKSEVRSKRGVKDRPRVGMLEVLEHRTLLSGTGSERIIDGYPTSGFDSVGYLYDAWRGQGFCSGTLIDSKHVLTTAHCADGAKFYPDYFVVGGYSYTVSQRLVHPSWTSSLSGTDSANDIAVLELSQSVSGVTPTPIYRRACSRVSVPCLPRV